MICLTIAGAIAGIEYFSMTAWWLHVLFYTGW
jgi:hypothetical protein